MLISWIDIIKFIVGDMQNYLNIIPEKAKIY